jgi:signal transduction histidine kinase
LEFFQADRERELQVYYQASNQPMSKLPATALFHSEPGTNSSPGLRLDYFEGNWMRLPDFNALKPLRSVIVTNLQIPEPNTGTNFALRFTGSLRIPVGGDYQFTLVSDDGSRLSFDERPWRITSLGQGVLPVPQIISAAQLSDESANWRYSEVAGKIQAVGFSEGVCAFDLVDDSGALRVEVKMADNQLLSLLDNSHARLRGVCFGGRKTGGPLLATDLRMQSLDDVEIFQLPAAKWRAYPSSSIAALKQSEPSSQVVKTYGIVREVVEGESAMIEDADAKICVQTRAAVADWKGQKLMAIGALNKSGSNLVLRALAAQLVNSDGALQAAFMPIGDIRTLPTQELDRGRRVKVRGVVVSAWNSYMLTVHDGDFGISCWAEEPLAPLDTGDYVEVEGMVRSGAFGPNLGNIQVRVIGRSQLPPPLTPPWGQIINGSLDHQWVEAEGVVHKVEGRTLTLEMVGGRIGIEVVRGDEKEINRLQDAIVRVRGVVVPIYNNQRQIEGAKLRVSSPLYIQVEESPKADPFIAPEKTFVELTRFDPGSANPFYRVKVSGQVIYAEEGEGYLMDGKQGLRFLPKLPVKTRPGDFVELVGFPELGGIVPVLREALVRINGHGELAVPKRVTVEELFSGKHESTRVQVDAVVVSSTQNQQERTLDLKFSGRFVTARLRGGQAVALDAPVGGLVRVTGTCVGRVAREGGKTDGCDLLVNYATDVTVLKRPPWWTSGRIMVLAGILASVLLAALAWIYLLHRKVDQRTADLGREMRQRKEAELLRAAEQERSRIARDLHDDLGSSLTEISLLAGLGFNHTTDHAANERFGEIAGKSRALVNNLDAIVWAADPEEDVMESFADYLTSHARVFLESSGLACRFKVPIDLPAMKLGGRVRHDLFLAVKETLNNVVRHAQATEVEFGLQLAGSNLELIVADNGRGFDPQDVSRGNGLNNLRSRLAGIGGLCLVDSRPGQGTRVKLSLDLKTAPL